MAWYYCFKATDDVVTLTWSAPTFAGGGYNIMSLSQIVPPIPTLLTNTV